MVEITPVAEADITMKGIINLRGQVIPVINLLKLLGLSEKENDQEARVVVVETAGKRVGLIVDRVLEVGSYKETDVETPRSIGCTTECISGFVKKDKNIWLLLNTSAVNKKIKLFVN